MVQMTSNFQGSYLLPLSISYQRIKYIDSEIFEAVPHLQRTNFFKKLNFGFFFSTYGPPILCKYSPNKLKLAEIMYLIKFHTLPEEKYYSISLKDVTPLERAIFHTPLKEPF